jgi:regulator of replication initiation timing
MAKKDLFDEFLNLSNQSADLASQLANLKDEITAVLEQNAELRMENQRLREQYIAVRGADQPKKMSNALTASKQNLEKIYGEGYHVCSKFYGQHLEAGESCAFCLDILYGDR